MLVRVAFVTLHQKCQRHERSTLNSIKNLSRECMLGSLCVLLVPTHPNSRRRVCKVTKPSNLRDEGVTVSISHLVALRLMSPRGAPCWAYTGIFFQGSPHLARSTQSFRHALKTSQCHLKSVC